ncbi:Soluble aldose sugar dehydrogenase YliI precursor [Planctomycetes bacterium Poly30]|uniref:Soluble aldose sugar dehydrogenase YliI n=1 Tax=Saltatorellus ferox TaxID=2528018 RepID=A0A518EWY7_9BACT|nr:Soluble aldose sugar dehydrogenase YliI precursor [Planctomycetes bacterium Poly30]
MFHRRHPSLTSILVLLAGSTAAAAPQRPEPVLVATAPGRPTSIAFAPGVTHQFYATDKTGRIWVMRGGSYLQTPFMDLRSLVNDTGEGGLLGMVFDPDFASNGYFYLSYNVGVGTGASLIARYSVVPGSVDVGDPMSAETLFGPVPQTTDRHKGGDLAFGPDGTLYFSLGDGGTADAAQDLASPLGKLHRIDPDLPFPHVPADNPFVAVSGALPTTWALGLRNPWRFDVDPATGDVFVGDVGESTWEEITRLAPGANGGWPCMEGDDCAFGTSCACNAGGLTLPIAQLGHSAPDSACAITGGIVYRGSAIPSLAGQYLFTDFCSGSFYGIENPGGPLPLRLDLSADVQSGGQALRFVVDFARDGDGEVHFVEHYGGRVWKLSPRSGFDAYCTAEPNSSGAAASLVASGSASIAAADLTLEVTQLPAQALGYFLIAGQRASVPGFGGSEGVLCLDQPIARWSSVVLSSGSGGQVSLTTDLTNLPPTVQIAPGHTWNFQYWTRDANPAPTSNTSSALSVTFRP